MFCIAVSFFVMFSFCLFLLSVAGVRYVLMELQKNQQLYFTPFNYVLLRNALERIAFLYQIFGHLCINLALSALGYEFFFEF